MQLTYTRLQHSSLYTTLFVCSKMDKPTKEYK